jgi:putative addiction module component (TIGR02574 family)
MTSAKEILDAALRLDPDQRACLLAAIADSLDTGDVGPGWEEEIARRLADLDAGHARTIPGDEVIDGLRRSYGG